MTRSDACFVMKNWKSMVIRFRQWTELKDGAFGAYTNSRPRANKLPMHLFIHEHH